MSDSRKRLLMGAKALFGLGLLVFLVVRTDLSALGAEMRSIRLGLLVLVVLIPHVAILLSAVKWRVLLRSLGVAVRTWDAFLLYLVGTFFNNFLPSTAGGDVVRAFQLSRERDATGAIIAATLVERVIGLGALVTFLPFAWFEPRLRAAIPLLGWLIVGAIAAYVVGVAVLVGSRWGGITARLPLGRFARTVARSADSVSALRAERQAVVVSFACSLAFYVLAVLNVWVALAAFGVPIGFIPVVAVVPLVMVVGMLPISLNGLGIKEASYVVLLGLVGVSAPEALAVAVLLRARALFTAALGGATFVIRQPRSHPRSRPDLSPGETEQSVA